MALVLGIDAAWTPGQPSGVALVSGDGDDWRLCALASSYGHFVAVEAPADPRPRGSLPEAAQLLAAAQRMSRSRVDVVAIDMPMALSPIIGRRASDNAVTRAYGARWCGTHSPSAARPGGISDRLRAEFAALGYPLRTGPFVGRGLAEVYPHPALVELAGADQRLPYKVSRISRYWPDAPPTERFRALFAEWQTIVTLLEKRIAGVGAAMGPLPEAGGWACKSFEDRLDALVCAWVGTCILAGRARPLGDQDSAIWVPDPPVQSGASM
jgi:predicted RNase H-like nuclease